MATVIVPNMMWDVTGGQARIDCAGATLKAVLARLIEAYPEAKGRLLDGKGELKPSVALFVDGVEVKASDGLFVPVAPHSEVVIVPAISGGR